MSEDKMPTEVTSTPLSGALLRRLAVAVGLVGAEGASVAEGAPWWLVPACAVLAAALWWCAVFVAEIMAAKAEADKVEDWQDLFWPRLLKRLNRSRYAQTREKWDAE